MLKTLSFFSNFLNHHQLPFCKAMVEKIGDGFRFIATEPVHPERLAMGYEDMNNQYPFVVRAYENAVSHGYAMQLANESDLVIAGSAPEEFIRKRVMANKITFHYSERIFKKGTWRIFDPRILKSLYENHFRYRHLNLYMLCASAYTAYDFSLVKCYVGKAYKWGYFPEVRNYDIESLLEEKRKNKRITILWAGRLLKWKHPEMAVYLAKLLRNDHIDFELCIIGEGEQENAMRNFIENNNLSNHVKMLGFLSPDSVRKYMESADIFLFTSDYQEGWGAVLSEAMNSGCSVVASHAIGSVPFLIENGRNGFVYKNNSLKDLYKKVFELYDSELLRNRIGKNAYSTMTETWNAEKAVENLINLYAAIKTGSGFEVINGPCSKAGIKVSL